MREKLIIIENFINTDEYDRKSEFNHAFARIIENEEKTNDSRKSINIEQRVDCAMKQGV